MPLLTNDCWRAELSKAIDRANVECNFELTAFVIMPEHVHLLTFPVTDTPDIAQYLAIIKQPFSRFVHQKLVQSNSPLLRKLIVRERPNKTSFRFWLEGPGFDRNLFSPKAIEASIDYIHRNPVERGLCRQATNWKWSSAQFYLATPPKQQFANLPRVHGIRPEAFDRRANF